MGLNFGNQLFPSRTEFFKSFDYKDTLRGNGYIQFFGGCTYNGAGTLTYILNTERFDTCDQDKINNTSQYWTTIPAAATTTLNFDTPIGTTMQVFGNVSCEFILKTPNNQPFTLIRATLYKYDGGETSIIEIGETTWTTAITGTANNWKRFSLSADLTTKFKLIKGDVLRLKLTLRTTGAGTKRLYHDPNNRETITISTNDEKSALILNVPFKTEN